jgi:hypothetical protein
MILSKIFLNHIYVVVDSETYSKIYESEYINNVFSGCEKRTTFADSGDSWSGFYIRGKNTYIEFFSPQKSFNLQTVGNLGIAFSVDELEELDSVYSVLLEKMPQNVKKTTRDKQFGNDKSLKWFEYLPFTYGDTNPPKINTWIMTYYPEYFNIFSSTIYTCVNREIANKQGYLIKKSYITQYPRSHSPNQLIFS